MNQFEYNGELMSLYAIAQKEGISLSSLIRALERESDDIYKAVEAVKDRQRLIIEYQGEMLTINQIAQREGVKPATLRKVYNELGNINAAVEQVKESLRTIRGRRISVEYRGKKTPLSVVAREEGIRYVALRDAYKELGDLSKAISLVKERQHKFRGEFEYNGERMTLSAIAKKEGVTNQALSLAYEETKDIIKAVELAKSRKRGNGQTYEYGGKQMTIRAIAIQEGISSNALRKALSEETDIIEAVEIAKKRQKANAERTVIVEYHGKAMSLTAIAREEGIKPASLKKAFEKLGDIEEAVRQVRESQSRHRAKRTAIEYHGRIMTLTAIAREEGISESGLRYHYQRCGNIEKAVLFTGRQKRKKEIASLPVKLDNNEIDLYSASIIIGIKYDKLLNMLADGLTIEEIISMKPKKSTTPRYGKGDSIVLENGQSLKDYCIENGLNYSCIHYSIYTYGKSVDEAIENYKKHGQSIPKTWIYDRYGILLRHLMIEEHLDIDRIVNNMRREIISIDEAIKNQIIYSNAKKSNLDFEWMQDLYEILKDEDVTDEEYKKRIQEFYVDEKEEECIAKSFDDIKRLERKQDLFEIAYAINEGIFTPEEEEELLRQYSVTTEEVEFMFIDLFSRFGDGVLRGEKQEEQLRINEINDIIRGWASLSEEERNDTISQHNLSSEEIDRVEKLSRKIERYKDVVKDDRENDDDEILRIMRASVGKNVGNNESTRAQIRKPHDRLPNKNIES